MRRLPIYFLLDIFESMVGEPIEKVQKGMRTIIQELWAVPYALETAFIFAIAFVGKAVSLSPLTELNKFRSPKFQTDGCPWCGPESTLGDVGGVDICRIKG